MADRSRRRCVLRKTAMPDATHYVGYVEDEETPEMIMKKFEELERIRAAAAARPAAPTAPASAGVTGGEHFVVIAPAQGDSGAESGSGERADSDAPLDQEALQAVFRATSLYNVKSLICNNEALLEGSRAGSGSERGADTPLALSGSDDELVEGLRGFWSDEDWGSRVARRSAARQRTAAGVRGSGSAQQRNRGATSASMPPRPCMPLTVTQYNRDTHALIRRRVRASDPDAILQLRLPPPPLPLSWGRPIRLPHAAAGQEAATLPRAARGLGWQPCALPSSRNCDPNSSSSLAPGEPLPPHACELHVTRDMTSFAFGSLRTAHFLAIMVNTGWEVRAGQQQQQQQQQQHLTKQEPPLRAGCGGDCGVPAWRVGSCSMGQDQVVARLARLPIQQLCPRGFVMLWADKEHLAAVASLLGCWGFSYVESLSWVLLGPGHGVLRLPCDYAARSHITLYIFRRDGEGRDIELRHQRNPDVVFDCVRAVQGREWDVPAQVFDIIETLLPTGKGAFLELWSASSAGRAGWTHIAEVQDGGGCT